MGEGLTRDDLERYEEERKKMREKEVDRCFFFCPSTLSIFLTSSFSLCLSHSFKIPSKTKKQADVLRAGAGARRARVLQEQEGHAGTFFFLKR